MTTGDQGAGAVAVATARGFRAAHVAVAPGAAVPQKYPHIGTAVPSGRVVVVGATVKLTVCWPKLALTPNRRIEATSRAAFMIALALKWQVRIVFSVNSLNSSFTVSSQRLINYKFPGIHQHHHQHAAGENIVRRNLALVVRVPHERPAALVGRVGLGVGRKQGGAIGVWGVGRAVRVTLTGRHRRPQGRIRT